MGETIVIGDRIRMTVHLVKVISEMPESTSLLVEVTDIIEEPDGNKVLKVKHA